MSKASDYIEKQQAANAIKPIFDRRRVASFGAELLPDGSIQITGKGENNSNIVIPYEEAVALRCWLGEIFYND